MEQQTKPQKKNPKTRRGNKKNKTQAKEPKPVPKTEVPVVEEVKKKQIRALVPKHPDNLEVAGNLVSDVEIQATLCENAFWTFPFGIIGMLATKIDVVDDRLFGYYWALLNDFNQIIFNQVPLLQQKPLYIASLFNSFKPKTIKTLRGNFTYSWQTGFTYNSNPQTTTNIRSTTWSFQKPSGADTGVVPQACVTMSVANIETAVQNFSELNQLLLNDGKLFQVVDYGNVNTYNNDVSAYSRASPYFGEGSCTSGSAYNSTENELPSSSMPTLGVFVNFVSPSNRVSRRLLNGSGDAVSAFSYPFIPGWKMGHYRTVHTPIFKFLDFSELYVVCVNWMAQALSQAYSDSNNTVESLWAPIPLGAFIGGLRQSLLQYFCNSQCIGQCLTYDDGSRFEPFHVQPNTAPKINQTMLLPAPLVEQLRALIPVLYNNQDRIGSSSKNVLPYIPVWGINPSSTVWDNPAVRKSPTVNALLFDNTDGFADTISWIDGKGSGGVYYNLNSSYFQGGIDQWNTWVSWVAQYCGATASISGTTKCNFLHMSRMINQNTVSLDGVEYPDWITKVPPGYRRDIIVRKQSKGREEIKKVLVRVKDGGSDQLNGEITTTITSYQPILAEFASFAPLILLPKYIVTNNGSPTAQNLSAAKLQVANRELFFERNQANTAANQLSNRFTELVNMGVLLSPGTAKEASSEFDRVAVWMQNMGEGGFIQDILSGAASVAGIIGV